MTNDDLTAIEARAQAATAGPWWMPDPFFIAHARQDIPALVAEVRKLQQVLHEQCAWCHGDEPHGWNDDCPRMLRCRGAL